MTTAGTAFHMRRLEIPKSGGIIGDLILVELPQYQHAWYKGRRYVNNPQGRDFGPFNLYATGPWSEKYGCYLHARYFFPNEGFPPQFQKDFENLMDSFETYLTPRVS